MSLDAGDRPRRARKETGGDRPRLFVRSVLRAVWYVVSVVGVECWGVVVGVCVCVRMSVCVCVSGCVCVWVCECVRSH